MAFRKRDKYQVEKWEDIDRLPEEAQEALLKAVSQIEANRAAEGKIPCNKYVVVNEDEPYSDIVWKLIEISQEEELGEEGIKLIQDVVRDRLDGMLKSIRDYKKSLK